MKTTETALQDDLRSAESEKIIPQKRVMTPATQNVMMFNTEEITLGLFLLYPAHIALLSKLMEPDEGFAKDLYEGLKTIVPPQDDLLSAMTLSEDVRQRAGILVLFCEENGFGQWNDSTAIREITKNCAIANQEVQRRRIQELSKKILIARREGKKDEEEILNTQFSQLRSAVS
jgi:hypothetical protein